MRELGLAVVIADLHLVNVVELAHGVGQGIYPAVEFIPLARGELERGGHRTADLVRSEVVNMPARIESGGENDLRHALVERIDFGAPTHVIALSASGNDGRKHGQRKH